MPKVTDRYEFYQKLNANCPDSEKTGSGPGSCGGSTSKEGSTKGLSKTVPIMSKDEAIRNGLINDKGKILKPFRESITRSDGSVIVKEYQKSGKAVREDARSARAQKEGYRLQKSGFKANLEMTYEQNAKDVYSKFKSEGVEVEKFFSGFDGRTSDQYVSKDKQADVVETSSGFAVKFSDGRPDRIVSNSVDAKRVALDFVDNSGPSDMEGVLLEPVKSTAELVSATEKMFDKNINMAQRFYSSGLADKSAVLDEINALKEIKDSIVSAKSASSNAEAIQITRDTLINAIVDNYKSVMNPITPEIGKRADYVVRSITNILNPTKNEMQQVRDRLGIKINQ